MDIRTGETYETLKKALAAGVPRSDIAKIITTQDGNFKLKFSNKKYPEHHQNIREITRRIKQQQKQEK